MAKNEIKLQYSGFMIFAARLVSVATGLAFQLMISRSAGKTDYDVWFNMNDVMSYVTLMAGVIPFWAMRFVARGERGAAKTGIFANMLISLIALFIYVPLVPFITLWLGISEKYLILYYLVAVEIVELYSINIFEACLRAKTPHVLGYGLLISELCKVVLGYVIIIVLQQPLQGALVSLIVATAIQAAYYSGLLMKEIKEKIRREYIKEWLKGSIANIYYIAGGQLAAFIFFMLFTMGGEGARGYYGVSALIANIITYSAFLAFALTPKLIAERKSEDVATSLKTVLMFAIPMTAGVIALTDSYLTILSGKELYTPATSVLFVLALDALVLTIGTVFGYVLFGAETVDEKARISFGGLIRSRLLIAFSLPILHSIISLPTAFYVLTSYVGDQPLQAALYISIINASARLVTFFIQYAIVRRMIRIDIPWKSIGKYVSASAIMGIALYVLPHPTRITTVLAVTVLGGIVYLALLTAIDEETRALVRSISREIKNRIKRRT